MPAVRVTLNDTYNSIFRPVVLTVVKQLQQITGLKKDIPIFFPKDSEKNITPGATIDPTEVKGPRLQSGNYMFIEVEEEHSPNSIATMDVNAEGSDPIFLDPYLGVVMTPIYTTRDVKINFRYVCKSENEAKRWREDMRSQVSRLREVSQHTVSFHYTIPLEYMALLMHIHTLRENQGGYSQTLHRYFRNSFCDRLTVVSSLDGGQRTLAISETQSNISGLFDSFPLVDKPVKDTTDGTWTISFSYSFSYNEPLDCHLRYPIMVHNQMLNNEYVAWVNTDPSRNKYDLNYQGSRKDLRKLELDYLTDRTLPRKQYIRIPEQDDYVIELRPPGVGTTMMIMCSLEPNNLISLLNLRDLGDYILDDDILEFIQESEYPFVNKLYHSIFHICLYRFDARLDDTSCRLDPDLNLVGTAEFSIRNQYRVHIGLVTDISLLTWQAIDRLRNYPRAFVKIIAALNEVLAGHPRLRELNQYKRIYAYHFNEIYRLLTGGSFSGGSNGNNLDYTPGTGVTFPTGDIGIPGMSPGTGLYPNGGTNAGISPNGRPVNGMPLTGKSMFGDIPDLVLKRIVENTRCMNTVQITGIMIRKAE